MFTKKFVAGCFILTLLLPDTIYSQASNWEIGILGGPSYSLMRITEENRYSYSGTSLGILKSSTGIYTRFYFPNNLALNLEFLYQQKGDILQTKFVDVHEPRVIYNLYKRNFNYYTIPILLNITIGDSVVNPVLFINMGTYFGFLDRFTKVYHGPFNHFDIGLITGIGFKFRIIENFSAFFELRNNLGLRNVDALDNKSYLYNSNDYQNNLFNLLVGVGYRIKQRG